MGQAPPGDSYNDSGLGFPLVAGAGDLSEGHVVPTKFTTAPTKLSQPDDVLLAIRASIGVRGSSPSIVCLGRGVAALRAQPKLDRDYLWHWAGAIAPQLAAKGRGATFLQVNRRDIGEMPIPLPSLDQQRKIARILDAADFLRRQRRASMKLLDILSGSVFDTVSNRARPGEGRSARLGQHLLFITSGARGWARYYAACGARFIRSLDVQQDHISDNDAVFVAPPDTAEARRTRVMRGDVLLTITGSRIGRVSAVPDELEGAYVSQHVAILRPDPRTLTSRFLAFSLSQIGGQRQVAQSQYGQTKPGLNFEQIRRFEIHVPPIVLQQEFVQRIQRIDELRASQAASLQMLDRLFCSLQHHAFSGRP
jgi:type I restriction enzyme, S subunit